MKHIVTFIIALGLSIGSLQAKVLTDQRGRKADVKVLGWNGNQVQIQNKAGKRTIIPLDTLIAKDRQWVEAHVKRDMELARTIQLKEYTTADGRTVKAELLGIKGMMVQMKSVSGREVELPLVKFSKPDQNFIVANAPHIGALNANPELRHSPIMLANAVKKIDGMMNDWYKQKGVKPNPIVDDSTFLRRAYLSVIGRVPTADEAKRFLTDRAVNKRELLIDELYEHEGYVHHMFNYWADLLRIKTRLQGRNYGAAYYAQWVKDTIRENKPYDKFVTEMLTAEGYYWDNPAVGFYRRDLNMPLDNLAVMTQTLLGSSIVCAQCHDHPFDTWTQKQYYEMAAYTYPMVTRLRQNEQPNIRELGKMTVAEYGKKEARQFGIETRRVKQVLIDYPLQSGTKETDRRLKYPKDYNYANAKPNSTVAPGTPFGDEVRIGKGDKTIAPFVDWFVSKKNPRFSQNIANRLFKEAMGLGMIEPADEIKHDSKAFNPLLMDFLTELVCDLDYDLKAYQQILRKTELFQREVYGKDVNPVDGYPFTGPLLRRMNAEQLWDSVVTLIIPKVDSRYNPRLLASDANIARTGQRTLKTPSKELFEVISQAKGMDQREARAYANKISGYGNRGSMMGMSMTSDVGLMEMPKQIDAKALSRKYAKLPSQERKKKIHEERLKADPWYQFGANFYRSAEIESPARGGHFLNMFGQSDREITENDNQEASIPQVLTLMNDSELLDYMIARPQSVLMQAVSKAATPREKIDVIWLSTYTRYPNDHEYQKLTAELVENESAGLKRIMWAVLNSQPYRFIE